MTRKASKLVPASLSALAPITLEGKLDIGDVLAIVTSRADTTYTEKIKDIQNRLKEARQDNVDLGKEIEEKAKILVEAHLAANVAKLTAVLKPLGGTVEGYFVGPSGLCISSNKKGEVYDEDSDEVTGKVLVGKITISIKESHRSYADSVSFKGEGTEIKPSAELLRLAKAWRKNEADIADLQAEAMEWKQRQLNIPVLERRYRALLAEKKLKATEGGDEILAVLTARLDQDILTLPVA